MGFDNGLHHQSNSGGCIKPKQHGPAKAQNFRSQTLGKGQGVGAHLRVQDILVEPTRPLQMILVGLLEIVSAQQRVRCRIEMLRQPPSSLASLSWVLTVPQILSQYALSSSKGTHMPLQRSRTLTCTMKAANLTEEI
jgi:hypothetical protein